MATITGKKELCAMLKEIIIIDSSFTVQSLTEGTKSVEEATKKSISMVIKKASMLAVAGKECKELVKFFVKYYENIKDVFYTLNEVYAVMIYMKSTRNVFHTQMNSSTHTCDSIHNIEVVGQQLLVEYNGHQKMTWCNSSAHYQFAVITENNLIFTQDERELVKNNKESVLSKIIQFVESNTRKFDEYVLKDRFDTKSSKKVYDIYNNPANANNYSLTQLVETLYKSESELSYFV